MEAQLNHDDVVDIAQNLLSSRFGGSQQLSDIEDLGGSGNAIVLRARVANSPFLPHRTVVLKYTPESGNAFDDASLVREIVAYQYTTSLPAEVRPGPLLLAHDLERRIVVLTDSGDGETLADLLSVADDSRRVHLLRQLGTALGVMHAGTAEREKGYDILFARMLRNNPGCMDTKAVRDEVLRASMTMGLKLLDAAGLDVPSTFTNKAEQAAASLHSAQLRGFTPFDLSPDNIIVAERMHFLDYEWAGFRNVIFDVACVIAGFPQFLFARPITDAEADVFISAWTREVKQVWPKVQDEKFLQEAVTSALVGWVLSSVTAMCVGGMDELVDAAGEVATDHVDADTAELVKHLLGSGDSDFNEDELLIRRDLYETFEALARFVQRCDGANCATLAEFASTVAHRLALPGV